MFKQFKKKPVVIDAVQWDGSIEMGRELSKVVNGVFYENTLMFLIPTLEGDLKVNPNDWVIRGVQGEYYPCKPDIFAATYDRAEKPKETKSTK